MRLQRRLPILSVLVGLAMLASGAPLASAQDDPGSVLRELQAGERDCSDVDAEDFAAIGEQVMGRQFPSEQAHESMDELMRAVMGERSEGQMHEFIGRRAAGCAAAAPEGFAAMMGMMGALGDGGAMMGGRGAGGASGYSDGMMGRSGYGDDDWGAGETVMVVLMALLVVLAAAALWALTRRSGRSGRSDEGAPGALARRYALGEIDTEEYERRRATLGGGS